MFFLTVYSDIFCSAFVHVSVLLCLLVLVLPFCSPFCCICVVFLIILIDMSNNCIVYCLLCVPAFFFREFLSHCCCFYCCCNFCVVFCMQDILCSAPCFPCITRPSVCLQVLVVISWRCAFLIYCFCLFSSLMRTVGCYHFCSSCLA